jgi:small-conductance mechanosensitive channel
MKTETEKALIGLNGKSLPKNENEAKSQTIDTLNGAKTADTTLNVVNEPKQVCELIEQIRQKAKLVSDLQNTIDRRQQLQKLYSEDKIKISIKPIDYTGRRDDLEFFNENIIDYIVKMLVEKSKEVENDIAAKLFELEK